MRLKNLFWNKQVGTLYKIGEVRYLTRAQQARGALFEVIRKVACAQISNMRMVFTIPFACC
jgi:hypothetical protein